MSRSKTHSPNDDLFQTSFDDSPPILASASTSSSEPFRFDIDKEQCYSSSPSSWVEFGESNPFIASSRITPTSHADVFCPIETPTCAPKLPEVLVKPARKEPPSLPNLGPPVLLPPNLSVETCPTDERDDVPEQKLQNDPKLAKYARMLKVGLPMEAVQNAMQRDGVSVEQDVEASTSNKGNDWNEQIHNDPKLSKYARMIKAGLPMEAVQNSMERDGVSTSSSFSKKEAPKVVGDKIQRVRIHWEAHAVHPKSIWDIIYKEQSRWNLDESELDSLFAKERNPRSVVQKIRDPLCIEPGRANNCGIILATIKKSYADIANAIENLDVEALTLEQVSGLNPFAPTEAEAEALLGLMKVSPVFRVEAEAFMAELLRIENAKQKMDALLFMKRFPACMDELKNDALVLGQACDEIMNSSSLRKILDAILHVGNKLNSAGDSTKPPVQAISLEFLNKLHQAKAFDKSTTFLEYVARILRRSQPWVLLQYKSDLVSLERAAKISWTNTVKVFQKIDLELASFREMMVGQCETADQELEQLDRTDFGRFILHGCLSMTQLYSEFEETDTKIDRLRIYMNDEKCSQDFPTGILQAIVEFVGELDVAVQKATDYEKAKVLSD